MFHKSKNLGRVYCHDWVAIFQLLKLVSCSVAALGTSVHSVPLGASHPIAGNFGVSKFWRIGELSPKLDTPKSFYCTKSWLLSAQAAKIKFAKT